MSAEENKQYIEVAKMLAEGQESDRGCVIVCAAMLEDELESLIRSCCRDDETAIKKAVTPLFQVYAPFSTFAAKIQVSYALGLIPPRLYATLELLRRLRNDFAHAKEGVSFQSTKYQPRFRAFTNAVNFSTSERQAYPDEDELVPNMGRTTKRQLTERLIFCLCIATLIGRISVSRDVLAAGFKSRREEIQLLDEIEVRRAQNNTE